MSIESSITKYRKDKDIKIKTIAEEIQKVNKCSLDTCRAMVGRVESGQACLYTVNLVL